MSFVFCICKEKRGLHTQYNMLSLLTNLRQQQKSSDQALINQKENVLQIKEKTSEYLLLEVIQCIFL